MAETKIFASPPSIIVGKTQLKFPPIASVKNYKFNYASPNSNKIKSVRNFEAITEIETSKKFEAITEIETEIETSKETEIETSEKFEAINEILDDFSEFSKSDFKNIKTLDIFLNPEEVLNFENDDIPNYNKISPEHQRLLKIKFIQAFDIMKEKYPLLTPDYSDSMSLKELHKKYNLAFDEIEISENINKFNILLILFWLSVEYVISYFGYDISGYTEYQRKLDKTFKEYITSYCKISYKINNVKKINPEKIVFKHEGALISINMKNEAKEEKKEDEPSLTGLYLNIGFTTFVNIIGFVISKYAQEYSGGMLTESINSYISNTIETMTCSSRKIDENIEETIEFIIPIIKERFYSTKILGINVFDMIIEKGPGILEYMFGKSNTPKTPIKFESLDLI